MLIKLWQAHKLGSFYCPRVAEHTVMCLLLPRNPKALYIYQNYDPPELGHKERKQETNSSQEELKILTPIRKLLRSIVLNKNPMWILPVVFRLKMNLFQKTPLQQYKALKENFCAKYSNENAWGNQTSGNRSEAYSQLIYFLKQSQELVELDNALGEEIYYQNVKLLLGN